MNSRLPTGTITFLFTDIEGSTQLWQRHRMAMQAALAQHDALLRKEIESQGGYVFKTVGDAFCAAFSTAPDGLRAAFSAQCALQSQIGDLQISVRMALHTGAAEERDRDYLGPPLNHVARLLSAGHGGQILLSLTTAELVHDLLPKGVTLRDLGEHRLKDISRPEHIFQLIAPDLPVDFPPLKTLDAVHTNLPAQLTTFIGRKKEMADLRDLITNQRLITLVGPGGTGKTRLSLQVAADLMDVFPNGVWFVGLEKVDSPEYLAPAVATALQFSIDTWSSDLDPRRQLLDYLSRRKLLMVLDNFEHLVEGAGLLTEILTVSPEARLMVTSRERLNLREEWVYPMGGMRYPLNGNGAGTEAYSGLALFEERARQVEPAFILDGDDAQAVIRTCQLVEGLPLGIELAAAWVGMLSCQEIVSEIEQNMDFLATTMRGVPEKHRSLRAIFDQTWRRLTDVQQAGFRKLAVFRGGFRREAASAVAGVPLPMLLEFAQKSLLRRDDRGRFEMHALLKTFAEEKIDGVPEERAAVSLGHSQYFVQFLSERQDVIQGERILELREEVREDSGNVRAAVDWAVTHWQEEDAHAALMSFGAYAQTEGFHNAMEYYRRLDQRLRELGAGVEPGAPRAPLLLNVLTIQAVNGATIGDPDSEALLKTCLPALRELELPYELGVALLGLGIWSEARGEYTDAIRTIQESLSLLRGFHDHFLTAAALSWLGWAYYELGEYDQAGEHYQDAFEVCMDRGNILGLPYVMSKLGTWADARQAYEQGLGYHQEAQRYFEAIGDQAGQGYALSRMSFSAWGMKAYDQALDFGRAGYEQFQTIGHRWGISTSLCRIGFAELALGHRDAARSNLYQGLERAFEYEYPSNANYALIGLAALWVEEGEYERAVELLTLCRDHASTAGLYRDIAARTLADLKAELPSDRFVEALALARTSDYDAVVAEIRRERMLSQD
ncbi:MAG: adenylate/guanylate cyclase domain-containing protein [Candidatus Promineifilaceae bacterium]